MRRRKRRRSSSMMGEHLEISLTPLIDTALTLLIIFMVTTPMIQNAIKVDLPEGEAKEADATRQELVVSIDKDEAVFVNAIPVTLATLGETLVQQLAQRKTEEKKRVWVKVDRSKTCSAGTLISVIDRIKVLGGVKDVAIATERLHTTI